MLGSNYYLLTRARQSAVGGGGKGGDTGERERD